MSRNILKTRNNILNSTWKLLETGQAKDVRMTDIAKDAGISRQAVYLHFPTRAELLVATTHHIDEVKNVDQRFEQSQNAATGKERLDAFIEAWGNYIPEIYSVAKALFSMKDSDEAAEEAWNDRMQAVRQGCQAAVHALNKEGMLSPDYRPKQATDILWTILSVRNWEQMTIECGWSQKQYIATIKKIAHRTLVSDCNT